MPIQSTETLAPADVLRQILVKAGQLKELAGTFRTPSTTTLPSTISTTPTITPTLHLPFPTELFTFIDTLQLPEQSSRNLKLKVTDKVTWSQSFLLRSFNQTCCEVSKSKDDQAVLDQLKRVYETTYQGRYVGKLMEKLLKLQSDLDVRRQKERKRKPVFNFEYTPLLEEYFETNAYPSAQDRLTLASRSMMTPRQIEVWFQNHRNRAKKEGKPLRRSRLGSMAFPQESISKHKFSSPEADVQGSPDNFSSDDESVVEMVHAATVPLPPPTRCVLDSFDEMRPAHAFPSIYRPSNILKSFTSVDKGHSFPPPLWPRRSTTTCKVNLAIDMDDFVDDFASRFNIRDGATKTSRATRTRVPSCHRSWSFGEVISLISSPHPAMIKTSIPPCHLKDMPIEASLSHRSREFCRTRKVSRLPSRFPTQFHASPHRPTFSPESRTSSCSSTTSSRSRLSSTSSNSSSGPATPPLTPTHNVQISDFMLTESDLRTFDLLFGSGSNASLINKYTTIPSDRSSYSTHSFSPAAFALSGMV